MSTRMYQDRQDAININIHTVDDGLTVVAPADAWRGTCVLTLTALIQDVLSDGPLDGVTVVVYDDQDRVYTAHTGTLSDAPTLANIASIDGTVIEDIEAVEAIKIPS